MDFLKLIGGNRLIPISPYLALAVSRQPPKVVDLYVSERLGNGRSNVTDYIKENWHIPQIPNIFLPHLVNDFIHVIC